MASASLSSSGSMAWPGMPALQARWKARSRAKKEPSTRANVSESDSNSVLSHASSMARAR
eukprot:scaffold4531_cov89-Isochrysis_galbana.AAC.2